MIVPTVTTYYVFGSYCNGIGISKRSEVRLCIRGSATVPTISFILSRAPRRCPPVYTDTEAALFTQVPRETVWKFRRGPKQELRGRREGAKGAIYVPLPLQRLTIQTPQAIFQTVSPRTRVNKEKQAAPSSPHRPDGLPSSYHPRHHA